MRYIGEIFFALVLIVLLLFFSPAKFIIILPAIVAFIFVLFFALDSQPRKFLFLWFTIALFLRIFTALLINTEVPETEEGFFFPDARSYHMWGGKIADTWAKGIFPDLFSETWVGTFHTAYYQIIAGLYLLFGPRPEVPIFANCLANALAIVFIFYIAHFLFPSTAVARTSTIIFALHPSFWFWSSFLLKDSLYVLFFLWAVLIFFLLSHKYNYWLFILLLTVLYFVFHLRAYGAFLLTTTFFVYLFLWSKQRLLILAFLIFAIFALIAASQIKYVEEIYEQVQYSFLTLLPDEYQTTLPRIYLLLFAGTIKFFLAPFAWVFPKHFDIYMLLYPGQWFLYLFIFPFALVGIYYALRRNLTPTFILLFPVALSLYLFLLVYKGVAPRQRLFLEAFFIILAGFGLNQRINKKFLLLYYAVLFLGIIAHLLSIKLRYGTFIP